MQLDDFIELVNRELPELGGVKSSTVIDDLADWNSMHVLILVAAVEENYKFDLTKEHLKQAVTFEDVFSIISQTTR